MQAERARKPAKSGTIPRRYGGAGRRPKAAPGGWNPDGSAWNAMRKDKALREPRRMAGFEGRGASTGICQAAALHIR